MPNLILLKLATTPLIFFPKNKSHYRALTLYSFLAAEFKAKLPPAYASVLNIIIILSFLMPSRKGQGEHLMMSE